MAQKKQTSMTFWEHIEELRKRVIIASLFVIVGAVAGYILYPYFVHIMQVSLGEELFAFQISEGFIVRLKIAVAIGLFVSLPVVIFELVLFIFPALKKNEKKILLALLIAAYILFLGGMAFAFNSVLPMSIQFLKSPEFNPDKVGRMIRIDEFLNFYTTFLLGFGLCFEFPVVILLLMKFNIASFRFFMKNFKYIVIVIFVLSALITPPDIISQLMMALPMLVLYVLTLAVAKLTGLAKKTEGP